MNETKDGSNINRKNNLKTFIKYRNVRLPRLNYKTAKAIAFKNTNL